MSVRDSLGVYVWVSVCGCVVGYYVQRTTFNSLLRRCRCFIVRCFPAVDIATNSSILAVCHSNELQTTFTFDPNYIHQALHESVSSVTTGCLLILLSLNFERSFSAYKIDCLSRSQIVFVHAQAQNGQCTWT